MQRIEAYKLRVVALLETGSVTLSFGFIYLETETLFLIRELII